MCRFFDVSHSGYYDYIKRMDKPDRDEALAAEIARCQEHSRKTYGYRRVQLWLEQQGIHRNPKTILRIMRKYGLLSEVRPRKKYRIMGQQLHRYENLLNRDCTAQLPNQKWGTDILKELFFLLSGFHLCRTMGIAHDFRYTKKLTPLQKRRQLA